MRLRTVSSDVCLREDCFRGAKFLASLLESLGARRAGTAVAGVSVCTSYFLFNTRHAMCAGAEIKLSRPFDDKHPVLLGRLGRNPDRPTICFYGHYGQSWRPSLALMLHALVVGRTAL